MRSGGRPVRSARQGWPGASPDRCRPGSPRPWPASLSATSVAAARPPPPTRPRSRCASWGPGPGVRGRRPLRPRWRLGTGSRGQPVVDGDHAGTSGTGVIRGQPRACPGRAERVRAAVKVENHVRWVGALEIAVQDGATRTWGSRPCGRAWRSPPSTAPRWNPTGTTRWPASPARPRYPPLPCPKSPGPGLSWIFSTARASSVDIHDNHSWLLGDSAGYPVVGMRGRGG